MKPKKLFLASAALTVFSLSMIFFQLSCKKDANAQNNGTSTSQLNILIFAKVSAGDVREIWTSNYDGTNQTRVNIILPNGVEFADEMAPKLSTDGQKLFFEAGDASQPKISGDLYVCNRNGSGVIKIIDRGVGGNIQLGGAY